MINNKGKHLDLSKRQTIANALEQGLTAKQIGALLGLDPTSISREISKKFEETVRGTLQELALLYKDKTAKGEFVITVEGFNAIKPSKKQL